MQLQWRIFCNVTTSEMLKGNYQAAETIGVRFLFRHSLLFLSNVVISPNNKNNVKYFFLFDGEQHGFPANKAILALW